MDTIIFATGNKDKMIEIRMILAGSGAARYVSHEGSWNYCRMS